MFHHAHEVVSPPVANCVPVQKDSTSRPTAARVIPFTSIQSVHSVPFLQLQNALEVHVLAGEPLVLKATTPKERDEYVGEDRVH